MGLFLAADALSESIDLHGPPLGPAAAGWSRLLRRAVTNSTGAPRPDPKVLVAVDKLVKLALAGQKTVVFTQRLATAKLLQRLLQVRLGRMTAVFAQRSDQWRRHVDKLGKLLKLPSRAAKVLAKIIAHAPYAPDRWDGAQVRAWWSQHRPRAFPQEGALLGLESALGKGRRLSPSLRWGVTRPLRRAGVAECMENLLVGWPRLNMDDGHVTEPEARDDAGRPGGCRRELAGFVLAAGVAAGCIVAFVGVGGGAAGFAGFLLLGAPGAALVVAFLVPRFGTPLRLRWLSLALGVALPYALASCELVEYAERTAFDPLAWKAAAGGRSQARIHQIDHLLASSALDGRTRAQVLDLLGPDDSAQGTGWGRGYFADWESVYWLGDERGFIGIDSEWLVLRFDARGRVAERRIVRD